MVVSVCEFLTDVVFQDFPAEVFLQRPSIVKVGCAAVSFFDPGKALRHFKPLQQHIVASPGERHY